MFNEKWQAVKDHLNRNQAAYISGVTTGILCAGTTMLIMRGRHAENSMSSDGHDGVTMRLFNFFRNNNSIVTVIEREGRGHPGYLVRCIESGNVFTSQSKAANSMNIPEIVISKHLTGKFPDANGYHFERITT